jgi:ornithine cyclodeaminase
VESRASALREAGDVIQATRAGALAEDELVTLAALVRGDAAPAAGRPRLFKSTGMAWEDLVLAQAVLAQT